MNAAIDRDESRRIRNEIRRVLLQVWDPIGIRDEPNAQDEYDDYLADIYELLIGKATDKELNNHLCRIVEEPMGLHPNSAEAEKTVRALREIQIPKQPSR